MNVTVDYISFTLKTGEYLNPLDETLVAKLFTLCDRAGLGKFIDWLTSMKSERAGGRKIYSASFYWIDTHIRLFFGGAAHHVLFEISGTGCQALRDADLLYPLLYMVYGNLTRIDIAADAASFGSPKEFVAAGHNKRFKSSTSITSASGDTEYVGATKSDRYARIYRYNAPHPRAGLTRVEMVSRAEHAKAVGALIVEAGLSEALAALGRAYGWRHSSWQAFDLDIDKLSVKRSDRHNPERLKWLYEAVKPALVKSHREGLINLADFFEDVLKELDSKL